MLVVQVSGMEETLSVLHRRSKPSYAKFCPFCGVEALERDYYEPQRQRNNPKCEFVCRACSAGFRLDVSARATTALQMLAEHRKLRVPHEHNPAHGERGDE